MKKKGFTIIELLGVVVIISILGGIVVAAIMNYIKEAEVRYNDGVKKQILISGKNYFSDNKSELPNSTYDTKAYSKFKAITVSELRSKNYVNKLFSDYEGRDCSNSYVHVEKPSNSSEHFYTVCMICEGKDGEVVNYDTDILSCNITNWDDDVNPTCTLSTAEDFLQPIKIGSNIYNPYGITLHGIDDKINKDENGTIVTKEGKIAYVAIINSKNEVAQKIKVTGKTNSEIEQLLKGTTTSFNKYLAKNSLENEKYKVVLYDTGGNSSNTCAEFDIDRDKSMYQVKYNANGGSGTMENTTHEYYVSSSLKSNSYTKKGYSFTGWSTTSTGTVKYNNGASLKIDYDESYGENYIYNLYAQWKINTKTITVKSNPSSAGTPSPSTLTIEYGDSKTVTLPTSSLYEYGSVSCTGGITATKSGNTLTITNTVGDTASETCTVSYNEVEDEEPEISRTVTVQISPTSVGSASPTSKTVLSNDYEYVTLPTSSSYEYSSTSCTGGVTATKSGSLLKITNNTTSTAASTCTVYYTSISSGGSGGSSGGSTTTPTFTCTAGSRVSYGGLSWTVKGQVTGGCGLVLNGTAGSGSYDNSKSYLTNTWLPSQSSLNALKSNLYSQSGYYVTTDGGTSDGYYSASYWVGSSQFYNNTTRPKYKISSNKYIRGLSSGKSSATTVRSLNATTFYDERTTNGYYYPGINPTGSYTSGSYAVFPGASSSCSTSSAYYSKDGRSFTFKKTNTSNNSVNTTTVQHVDINGYETYTFPMSDTRDFTIYQCGGSNASNHGGRTFIQGSKKNFSFNVRGSTGTATTYYVSVAGLAFTSCYKNENKIIGSAVYKCDQYPTGNKLYKRTYDMHSYNRGSFYSRCIKPQNCSVSNLNVTLYYRPYIIVKN